MYAKWSTHIMIDGDLQDSLECSSHSVYGTIYYKGQYFTSIKYSKNSKSTASKPPYLISVSEFVALWQQIFQVKN